jgi:DNA-binding transcriptional MerR regulator
MSFEFKDVCSITGVSPRQLLYWTNTGLITDSASSQRMKRQKFRYNLRDILIVLVIRGLRDKGLSLQRIRKSVERVKKLWGKEHPLAQLRVACLANSIVYKKDGVYIDALTGQQVIEVAMQKIRNSVESKRLGKTESMVIRAKERFLDRVSEM